MSRTKILRLILLLLFLTTLGIARAQKIEQKNSGPRHIQPLGISSMSGGSAACSVRTQILPGNRVFPEGVAYDELGQWIYVGSSEDGTIYRAHPGDDKFEVFLQSGGDGRWSALGLRVHQGRLYVAGGRQGSLFIYDLASKKLVRRFETEFISAFLDDVVVTRDGTAYVTEPSKEWLFRLRASQVQGTGLGKLEAWLDFNDNPSFFNCGAINANGIVVSQDDRTLIVANTGSGKLFTIDRKTRRITEIDLHGASLEFPGGLFLNNKTLYVAEFFNRIARINMSKDLASGHIVHRFEDPSFNGTSSVTLVQGKLAVVNSQLLSKFDPALPFTITTLCRK